MHNLHTNFCKHDLLVCSKLKNIDFKEISNERLSAAEEPKRVHFADHDLHHLVSELKNQLRSRDEIIQKLEANVHHQKTHQQNVMTRNWCSSKPILTFLSISGSH
jgi:hypothetical protein